MRYLGIFLCKRDLCLCHFKKEGQEYLITTQRYVKAQERGRILLKDSTCKCGFNRQFVIYIFYCYTDSEYIILYGICMKDERESEEEEKM